jgi:hypothetical protein
MISYYVIFFGLYFFILAPITPDWFNNLIKITVAVDLVIFAFKAPKKF